MIAIFGELDASRDLLESALDRYVNACSAIQSHCTREIRIHNASHLEEFFAHAANELPLFTSYEKRLKQAKAAISATRNYSTTIIPVNTLPPELLSHIFSLTLSTQDCIGEQDVSDSPIKFVFPKHPDLLTQVCSHWRRVAIGTPTLWSFINIVIHQPISKGLLVRAEAYAVRSSQSPLWIHILDLGSDIPGQREDEERLFPFLASIGTRIGSLELVLACSWSNLHSSILSCCFTNGAPGVLTRLTLLDKAEERQEHGFLEAAESPHSPESTLLEVSNHFLDDLWQPITVLRLDGIFPHWTSKAYHGLVELQLSGIYPNRLTISESQLVGILASSPRLRTLFVNVPITDFSPGNASIVQIPLGNLQDLGLGYVNKDRLGNFLRLIAPSLRMSQLSFTIPRGMAPPTAPVAAINDNIESFFSSSNISTLFVTEVDTLLWVPEFYRLAPQLQVLVLAGCDTLGLPDPTSFPDTHAPGLRPSTEQLYLLYSEIHLIQLQWILERYPVHTLTLWRSTILNIHGHSYDPLEVAPILAQYCPVVNILDDGDPNPTADWSGLGY